LVGIADIKSHAAGRQKNDLQTMRRHPVFDFGLASQIYDRAAWIAQQRATFALEPAHHGAAHHAMLPGDPDKFIGQIEKHRRIFSPPRRL
jgi:hypothetical protein